MFHFMQRVTVMKHDVCRVEVVTTVTVTFDLHDFTLTLLKGLNIDDEEAGTNICSYPLF